MKMLKNNDNKINLKGPLAFIFLMGLVSLLSDMTHEGAKSILGAYLAFMGASAAAIGFISGFGEFLGYSLRLFTGFLADKTKKYWLITLIGYAIDLFAIPALALIPQNGWIYACILIIIQRTGKALKKPAKNTLVSFAASEVGQGKSFAILEFIDQIGAFSGPLILFFIMLFTSGLSDYKVYVIGFTVLGIPALLCMATLFFAKTKYPHPEEFEKEIKTESKFKFKKTFVIYLIAISIFAFGYVDFPIITMHEARNSLFPQQYLPLLYSGAMLIDAFSALFFGWLYDKKGVIALAISVAISATFAIFIFGFNSVILTIIGIILWGLGMGAQESILKSQVSRISTKENRSKSFGIFETTFGLFWFLGSWLMGALYDVSITSFIVVSVVAEILSLPFFIYSAYLDKKLSK